MLEGLGFGPGASFHQMFDTTGLNPCYDQLPWGRKILLTCKRNVRGCSDFKHVDGSTDYGNRGFMSYQLSQTSEPERAKDISVDRLILFSALIPKGFIPIEDVRTLLECFPQLPANVLGEHEVRPHLKLIFKAFFWL